MHLLALGGGNSGKSHLIGLTACLLLPAQKQADVRVSDVLFFGDAESAGCLIDPLRRAFNFAKVANGGLIHHDMALAIAPFSAEFFVAKARLETYRLNNPGQRLAVFHTGLNFRAGLMTASFALAFISDSPLPTIFP